MPAGCKADNWQVEEYSFYGAPGDVQGKVSKANFPIGRRFFFAVVTTADSGSIYEFEQKSGNTYSVRSADVGSKSSRSFNSDIVQAIYDNEGRDCVGEKIRQLNSYKGVRFGPPTEEQVDSSSLASLVTSPKKGDFVHATYQFLC
jgi:hypothetical protein